MLETPNLSNEFHPVPKPNPKVKLPPKPIGAGKKTKAWDEAREQLKKVFTAWGIVTCELEIDGVCVKNNFLGFAHVDRRAKLTEDDVKDPKKVALACQPCHHVVDFLMGKDDGKKYIENKIFDRIKRLKNRKRKIWKI